MDYWRLFLVTAFLMGGMAFVTCLCCWIHTIVHGIKLRREWDRQEREEQEIEERRARAPRYMTYEQFQADVRDLTVPLDDILDRLNGEFPPKAADIQKAGPPTPASLQDSLSGPILASVLGIMAVLACIYGVGLKPEGVEILIKSLREKEAQSKSPTIGGGK